MLGTLGSAGTSNGSGQGDRPSKQVSREREANEGVFAVPGDVSSNILQGGVWQACLAARSPASASSGRPL